MFIKRTCKPKLTHPQFIISNSGVMIDTHQGTNGFVYGDIICKTPEQGSELFLGIYHSDYYGPLVVLEALDGAQELHLLAYAQRFHLVKESKVVLDTYRALIHQIT